MGICWYCYWGWAKPVADIYKKAVEMLNGDEFPLLCGPSHTVWDNENWHCVEECLNDFDKNQKSYFNYSDEELKIVKWSLEELAKIPLKEREIEPEDYDDENPQKFPPPSGVEVVNVFSTFNGNKEV